MFINSIHISLYDISLTQNILYQIERGVAVWKILGCPQRNQRTWWQIVATPSGQFRNWNWNWNWWNWKWNWNWKPWNWNWNWNWKPELIFLQWLPQHLLVNQPFPNFSLNRGGHDLSCDWLLMQQVCSWVISPPVVWSQKTHGEGTSFPLSRQRPEGLKLMTIKISLLPWQTKLLSLLNKWMISGLGWNYPNIQVSVSFHWYHWYLQIFYDNPLR